MNEGLADLREMIFCPGSLSRDEPGKFDRAYDGSGKALPESAERTRHWLSPGKATRNILLSRGHRHGRHRLRVRRHPATARRHRHRDGRLRTRGPNHASTRRG